MPAKLRMKLQNQQASRKEEVLKSVAPPKVVHPGMRTGLRLPMVARIQHIRPGCGSCGK